MTVVRSKRFLFTLALIFTVLLAGAAPMFGQELVTRAITLKWDPSPSSDVAGYRIHYGQQTGYYPQVVDVGNSTTGEVPNLIEGTTFYFVVTAYSSEGAESDPSEEFHYMPNAALFLNLSSRAMVQTGDNVLIAGFVIGGMGAKKTVVRALGPSLAAAKLKNVLADPVLEIHGADGGLLAMNDNWQDANGSELSRLGLGPPSGLEPGLVMTLTPGNYTAIVRGKNSKTGLALLEVYDAGAVNAP